MPYLTSEDKHYKKNSGEVFFVGPELYLSTVEYMDIAHKHITFICSYQILN